MLRTLPIQAVARELMRHPGVVRWPYELSAAIKDAEGTIIRRGTVGRILVQMENTGWLVSQHEPKGSARGRAHRRYYTLTANGLDGLAELLELKDDRPVAV